MSEVKKYPGKIVFGLDIGTRSIVGTVGYRSGSEFRVVAQRIKEHESRTMIDGQIHDIAKVGDTIQDVKNSLEAALGSKLTEVCIAAAGRVLRTISCRVEWALPAEREVNSEDIYALASMGVEKAYGEFDENNEVDVKFYCVGYSIVRYYLNGYQMGNLEGHKAKEIGADIIATFLPDDVVDGLYKAVGHAGLEVASLTLEPIAAIQVAIPERFRMLNIGLVDVGAGTSDISITKDGSIVAYGMIAIAGDALTEVIAQHCLVDFATAEQIKRDAGEKDVISYTDIMFLPQTISKTEVLQVTDEVTKKMAGEAAEKIKELNGNKSVSAVFVVGGGGKIPGYTDALAEALQIPKERVALRGEEVMQQIIFEEGTKKDSLLVTPVGICLNYYEQSNNFIFVHFNGKRIKIYDNNRLAVVDAAMQALFPNDALFPKRGKELTFYVNGKAKMIRGQAGEAAVITVNGENADIYTPIHSNDVIVVKESTAGEPGEMTIGELPELKDIITVFVNDKKVELPKFALVDGELQSIYYDIKENDEIELNNYYTVRQIADFMDVILDRKMNLYVNNKLADEETPVYENFSVIWTLKELPPSDLEKMGKNAEKEVMPEAETKEEADDQELPEDEYYEDDDEDDDEYEEDEPGEDKSEDKGGVVNLTVTVNGDNVVLSGKAEYVFVDIFERIDFDLGDSRGRNIVTQINGRPAQYMEPLNRGDQLEIYWK